MTGSREDKKLCLTSRIKTRDFMHADMTMLRLNTRHKILLTKESRNEKLDCDGIAEEKNVNIK